VVSEETKIKQDERPKRTRSAETHNMSERVIKHGTNFLFVINVLCYVIIPVLRPFLRLSITG
jgi:hypothetical protein